MQHDPVSWFGAERQHTCNLEWESLGKDLHGLEGKCVTSQTTQRIEKLCLLLTAWFYHGHLDIDIHIFIYWLYFCRRPFIGLLTRWWGPTTLYDTKCCIGSMWRHNISTWFFHQNRVLLASVIAKTLLKNPAFFLMKTCVLRWCA